MFEGIVSTSPLWIAAKIFILFGVLVYIIFAAVVVKQVRLMIETVQMPTESLLRTIAWVHFFIAVGVFVIGLIIL